MKKFIGIFAAVVAIFGTVVTVPAQASEIDVIAVIDTQFDGADVGTNVTHVCVTACTNNSVPTPPTVPSTDKKYRTQLNKYNEELDHYQHGVGIAEIIRKSNPSAHLVLIRAGSTRVGPVASQGLLDALRWVESNASVLGIDLVSASLNAGNGSSCKPVGGVRPADVVNSVNAIASAGIPILASAGNGLNKKALGYPACIPNVVAVSMVGRDGVSNANTDFIVRSDDTNFSTSVGLQSWRSSSAVTAMLAANWGSVAHVPNTRQQITLNVVN
jgi:hypothetical protein